MTPKGVSLHIGLNAVDPNHYAGWSGPLTACEADAQDMAAIAKHAGFARSDLLLTGAAKAPAMRAALGSAADSLQPGDLFLLTYSGHGGQLPDRDGDEPDGLDETWCLYDGQIVDDELYLLLSKFREGVRIFVLSDSCHSGSVVRTYEMLAAGHGTQAALGIETAGSSEPVRFRALPPDVALRTYRQNRAFYDDYLAKLPPEKDSRSAARASVRLISGCQDNQTSADGAFNGLFTGTLLRVWNEGRFDGNYEQFYRAILAKMPPTQTPNQFRVGLPDAAFDAQRPFAIENRKPEA